MITRDCKIQYAAVSHREAVERRTKGNHSVAPIFRVGEGNMHILEISLTVKLMPSQCEHKGRDFRLNELQVPIHRLVHKFSQLATPLETSL